MEIKSILLDVLSHTSGLGLIDNIKVIGSETETKLEAMDVDKTVIMYAAMHSPVDTFMGEFGMGNLGLLSSLTRLSNYSGDDAKIEVVTETRDDEVVPTTMIFTDTHGSKDKYRFMSKALIDNAMKVATFKGAVWDIEVMPTQQKVSQLAEVASIYAGIEPAFSVKIIDGDLVFEVGSKEGGIAGKRTFASNVDGNLNSVWSWPLSTFLSIVKLGMSGTCVVKFSDQGVCQIDIDSGVGVYSYLLPAISK